MNRDLYSNVEFTQLKEKLNKEIQRRSTYRWWDPLTVPSVGEDRSLALSLPDNGKRFPVDEKTYTINNPSEGSIERTRNIKYSQQGENPSGQLPDKYSNEPNTSAAQFNTDEMKNFLVGLSKIQDINLFYGREEIKNLAFRDTTGIMDAVEAAQKSELNKPLHLSDVSPRKNDPNGGLQGRRNPNYPVEHEIEYPLENGIYVMPSGESDGEELLTGEGPSIQNFYDDYGAKPGDSNFHPYNRFVSAIVDRNWINQGHNRDELPIKVREGGISSSRFGKNPRNPNPGNPYRSRPVYGGVIGSCQTMCTGLCYQTCDNQCSESCSTTCWNRCGEACTSSCGNVCTGCSTMCYTSCKTKCENNTGYACLKAGAKAVKFSSTGGTQGVPVKNTITVTLYTCNGCAYTCQFYPNKKTECWDSGCMGRCFTSCNTYCSTTCFGGCVDNAAEKGKSYKTGKGRGCSGGCTINCVGLCHGTCEGYCIQTCWHACKATCSDNCSWICETTCGTGCFQKCTQGCTGCSSCSGSCEGEVVNRGCVGCGTVGGCTSTCQHECNKNCVGIGCRSICGIEAAGACEANCRMNCMGTSCTAMCSDACSSQCTTCVNTCGFQCGACFRAGTLIETIDGPRPIEQLKVGDKVLTQSGKYHKVYRNFERECNDELIAIRAVGTPIIYTTTDHPFWVKKYIGLGNLDDKRQQIYSEPQWVEAKNIESRDKLCLYVPEFGDVDVDPGIAYMVGRWLGDGWSTSEKSHNGKFYSRFVICCGNHEVDDFELKLRQCNINYTKSEDDTACKYRIPSKVTKESYSCINADLISILKNCGKHAYGKEISKEIFNWNETALSYLLQGYIDADGHISDDGNRFIVTTVSKKLAYGMATIMRMLGRNPSWSERSYFNNKGLILGREVNMRDSYTLRSQYLEPKQRYSIYAEDGKSLWATVTLKQIPDHPYSVYNLSVEDDPTYYADGALVHNCTSLCSVGCGAACNTSCSEKCEHSCDLNCVHSCSDACGACSGLCYSCIGMCIGICSVKCESGCSSCTKTCGWWCDSSCNRQCFNNCSDRCLNSCSGSCSTLLHSDTTFTKGPERPPTSAGYIYPHPANRWEERESFRLFRDPLPPYEPDPPIRDILVTITNDKDHNLLIIAPPNLKYVTKQTSINGGVYTIDETTGEITINTDMIPGIIDVNQPNIDGGGGIFIVVLFYNEDIKLRDDQIDIIIPFGFEALPPIHDKDNNTIIIIQRDLFLYPEEENIYVEN